MFYIPEYPTSVVLVPAAQELDNPYPGGLEWVVERVDALMVEKMDRRWVLAAAPRK